MGESLVTGGKTTSPARQKPEKRIRKTTFSATRDANNFAVLAIRCGLKKKRKKRRSKGYKKKCEEETNAAI